MQLSEIFIGLRRADLQRRSCAKLSGSVSGNAEEDLKMQPEYSDCFQTAFVVGVQPSGTSELGLLALNQGGLIE